MTKMNEFSPQSKVWIYQSSRLLTTVEMSQIQEKLDYFTKNWTAHNQLLKAKADIKFACFIVFTVDESKSGASGCSIDKSVHFLQSIESQYGIKLFDRLNFAYLNEANEVQMLHKLHISDLYESKIICDETLFFDNLVANKSDFDKQWLKPLASSWHFKMIKRN